MLNSNKTYLKLFFSDILVALLWAIIFLIYYGYVFNDGDQAEHLPSVYNLIDNSLYPFDYFVTAAENQITVRYFYIQLVYLGSYFVPVNWFCFIATILSLCVSIFATIRIGRHWVKTNFIPVFVPLFVFFIFYNYWSIGANHIQTNTFLSETPALALGMLGLLLVIKRKYIAAFTILGFAALFHILWGLHFFGFVLFWVIFTNKLTLHSRNIIVGIILFFIIASPILFFVLQQQFLPTDSTYDNQKYYTILYHYRGFHHYLPSLFPLSHYVKFFMLTLSGFLSAILLGIRQKFALIMVTVFFLIGFVVYYIALEQLSIYSIGKLQVAKFSVIISMLMSICCGLFVAKTCSQFFEITALKRKIYLPLVGTMCILGIVLLTNSVWFYKNDKNIKYHIGNFHPSYLYKMHQWIAKNTATNAVFLVNPNNDSFQCEAKRSLVTGYRAIIHTPSFLLPWFRNFTQIYGFQPTKANHKNLLQMAENAYYKKNKNRFLQKNYRINFRLDNIHTCQYIDNMGTTIHQVGPWRLTRQKVFNSN